MNYKNLVKSITFGFLALSVNSAYAGNQGIHFYYGAGLGGLYVDDDPISEDAGLASVTLGFEEDGWAFEGKAAKAFESGDTLDETQFSYALGYRTIEKGGSYFKIKAGKLDWDVSDGTVFGVGIGFRLERDERLEISYEFSNQEFDSITFTDDFDLHLLTINYLFGGAPYDGPLFDFGGFDRGSSDAGPFYVGISGSSLDPDLGADFDTATGYGVIIGYALDQVAKGLAVELLVGATTEADSFQTAPAFPDEYTTTTIGLYAAYRTPGALYLKGRLGYVDIEIEDDQYIQTGPTTFVFDQTVSVSDSAFSYGLGFGYKLTAAMKLEAEYTTASFDAGGGTDVDPSIISLSFLYHF